MKKLINKPIAAIAFAALATGALAVVVSAPGFAKGSANYLPDNTVQNFNFDTMPKTVPDDYLTVLCVTCRHVHMISPKNGELSGQDSE